MRAWCVCVMIDIDYICVCTYMRGKERRGEGKERKGKERKGRKEKQGELQCRKKGIQGLQGCRDMEEGK